VPVFSSTDDGDNYAKEFSLGLAEGLQGIISRLDDRFAQS